MNFPAASKPLVDWTSLGKVFILSAVFAIGVVVVMSIGIRFYSQGETNTGNHKVMNNALAIFMLIIVVAAVGFGVYIMTLK